MDSTLFCTKSAALADVATRLSALDASRRQPVQGSAKVSAPSKPEEGTSPPPGTESRSYTARDDLPRGLPNTTVEACQEFMLAIAVQGMINRDIGYVGSPVFIAHLCYVGLEIDTAVRVQTEYLMGRVNLNRLSHMGVPQTRRVSSPGP